MPDKTTPNKTGEMSISEKLAHQSNIELVHTSLKWLDVNYGKVQPNGVLDACVRTLRMLHPQFSQKQAKAIVLHWWTKAFKGDQDQPIKEKKAD